MGGADIIICRRYSTSCQHGHGPESPSSASTGLRRQASSDHSVQDVYLALPAIYVPRTLLDDPAIAAAPYARTLVQLSRKRLGANSGVLSSLQLSFPECSEITEVAGHSPTGTHWSIPALILRHSTFDDIFLLSAQRSLPYSEPRTLTIMPLSLT